MVVGIWTTQISSPTKGKERTREVFLVCGIGNTSSGIDDALVEVGSVMVVVVTSCALRLLLFSAIDIDRNNCSR
jgi:hypothetical protein